MKTQVVAIALFVFLAGCVTSNESQLLLDSPAPACKQYSGVPPIGGCPGKSAIINLEGEPVDEFDRIGACLSLSTQNCYGGVLEITHTCGNTPVVIGGKIIPNYGTYEIIPGSSGNELVVLTNAKPTYSPSENTDLSIDGTIGNEKITIQYTKTKELC